MSFLEIAETVTHLQDGSQIEFVKYNVDGNGMYKKREWAQYKVLTISGSNPVLRTGHVYWFRLADGSCHDYNTRSLRDGWCLAMPNEEKRFFSGEIKEGMLVR